MPPPPRPCKPEGNQTEDGRQKSGVKHPDTKTNGYLRRLHVRLGHRSNETLLDVLERAGAKGRILELAAQFKCEACERHRRKPFEFLVAPRSPATPGKAIETDGFYWADPWDNRTWAGARVADAGAGLSCGALNLKGKLMRS